MNASAHDVKAKAKQAFGAFDGFDPHSVEAEESVLGGILIISEYITVVAGMLEPEDFFIIRNQWVYEAILELWRADKAIDNLTLAEQLKETGRLEEVGGAVYITYLMNKTPSGIYVDTYAQIVRDYSDRRKLRRVADALANAARSDTPLPQVFAESMSQLADAKPRSLDNALTPGSSISDRFLELQSADEDEVTIFPLPFGGEDDEKGLPFLTSGKLLGIGGDEKTGKSALAETLGEHWASLGLRGFYIHTEEKPDAKVLRRYSRYARIPFLKLETKRLSDKELEQRAQAIAFTSEWEANLDLWYESSPSPGKVIALIRRAIEVYRVKFIVLDNFTDVDFSDRRNGVSHAQAAMKLLQDIDDLAAKENILIVLVTQMTTQESGKRIAFGTSAFNKKMTWFWDINRKLLKHKLVYTADGEEHIAAEGTFDPRVDIYVPASRYGSGAKIQAFADLRRFYWRSRDEIEFDDGSDDPGAYEPHWSDDK
jgi:replicative DNA helicase